jgi:hypothetical protein
MTEVWSEVDPALTSYTDCTYCSVLMVIVASGFTAFPLGAYTHAERNAFRGGDTRLNFGGPVDRALARYSVNVVSPTPYSQSGLQAALAARGNAFAVAGRTANFPAGHPIRRWDPTFSGFHAVCVIPFGNGQVLWLDPLAPMGFVGDVIPASDVTNVFALGNYPNDARYLPVSMVNDVNLKGTPIEPVNNRKTTLTSAAGFTEDPTAAPYNNLRVLPAGTVFTVDWIVQGNTLAGTDRWYGGWATGPAQFGYVISANCGPLVPIETVEVPGPTVTVPGPFTQADVDKAVSDAIAAIPEIPPLPTPSVDVAGALTLLNAMTTQTNRIATARSEVVRLKNAAKVKLGG